MRGGSRILLAVVVLGAIVAWARCSYTPPQGDSDFNGKFAGCFEGSVTDPPSAGTVVVVLEEPVATDQLALSGCLRAVIGEKTPFLGLAGIVQDDREKALFGGVEAGKPGFLTIEVVRRPPTPDDATEIDVTIEAGGDRPFSRATNLTRCAAPVDTCASLAAALAPAPQPVLELP